MKRIDTFARLVCIAVVVAVAGSALPAGEAAPKAPAGWKIRPHGDRAGHWTVGTAKLDPAKPGVLIAEPGGTDLVNTAGEGVDLYTEATFGDCIVTLEVMVPKGSNSGIYLMGEYELQVLDSFGRTNPGPGDMGGIYNVAGPTKPVYKPAGEWQKLEVHFLAPRFDEEGKKIADAKFVRITLNGSTIHENVTVKGPTGGQLGPEASVGPLMFQGDHGAVAFRNIRIVSMPLNGKDLSGWKSVARDKKMGSWTVGTAKLDPADAKAFLVDPNGAELINAKGHGVDIYTDSVCGDCTVDIEVMVPKGSNSGVYLMGEYEVQVLDSFGRTKPGPGDMGGIYKTSAPTNPQYKPAGEWQKLEMEFLAPRFDAEGKKVTDAKFVKIVLNGGAIHENVEVKGPTGGHLGAECALGPVLLQGNHGVVACRNIRIIPAGFAGCETK